MPQAAESTTPQPPARPASGSDRYVPIFFCCESIPDQNDRSSISIENISNENITRKMEPSAASADQNAYPYNTERVRELLKHKRKVRGIRSCFPCRHRKVRCDGHVPCASCVQRNHPELCRVPTYSGRAGSEDHDSARYSHSVYAFPRPHHCLYEESEAHDTRRNHTIADAHGQPQSQAQAQPDTPDPKLLISRLEAIQDQLAALKADLQAKTRTASPGSSPRPAARTSKSPGGHFVEDATGATIFLGSHSDTPLALGCRQAATAGDAMLHEAMMDQFVPRAYPFTSLWGPDAAMKEVCETLPDDSDTIR